MKKITYLLLLVAVNFAFAQDYSQTVSNYLNANKSTLNLQPQDIADIAIERHSFSKSLNLENVYALQRFQGIEIFNSSSSFAVKNGNVVNASLRFETNLSARVNSTQPSISPLLAISKAATALNLSSPSGLVLLENENNKYVFSNGSISTENIPVKLVYQVLEDNTLHLAWDLSISLKNNENYYSVRIDALTGVLLNTHDWVANCTFDVTGVHNHKGTANIESPLFKQPNNTTKKFLVDGAQYNVFGLPIESPNHGVESIQSNPANAVASPFGWHDTNGVVGAEFTTTRGNNVRAQEDRNGNDGAGDSPDGGADLNFNFPFNFNTSPVNMVEAATVNLFFWNNIMHDVWYQYGFDEASGNFQENNYDNGGNGSDSVNADAQDGSGLNNANFGTPPDGGNPRMQMFLWDPVGPAGQPLTINNGPLAGGYLGLSATFGAPLPSTPLTSDLVLVIDDNSGVSTDENDGCDPYLNAAAVNGKIAVIRRGECEFGFKVLAAEDAGAIAVIIVNNVAAAPIAMGPGAVGDQVTIPSIMVTLADGEAIIAQLTTGATVNASLVEAGPFNIDGDVDNGIIAHEYGHGISNRLTGGPAQAGCLQNEEQMGEGWSDWFGLMLTIEPGDTSVDRRGIGTYVIGQNTTGTGIRPRPYSTDFAINGLTYDDTNNPGISRPHGIGSIWATMLWDLNWALIDQYGFDADFYNGTGGNNIAMQLVIDGLKLQSCSPGFIDGRDAILAADVLANAGANRCLIWNVFARRGLGFSADQGSSNNRLDQEEAFDLPTDCALGVNDEGLLDKNFQVYPNPSNGNINIQTLIPVGDVSVTIVDMNGRQVFNQAIVLNNTTAINAVGLQTGVYILKIDGGAYTHTERLIIK